MLRVTGYAAAGFALFCVAPLPARAQDAYSHSVHVTPLLVTGTTVTGQPIRYPKTGSPEVRILRVEIPPGAVTGWHIHPVPCYGYVLSGTLTVKFASGQQTVLRPGDALAEAVNTIHEGVNEGKEPVRLIMVVTGVKNEPFAIKEASH